MIAGMYPGDFILTVFAYMAGALLIISIPVLLITHLIKGPIAYIIQSYSDMRYRMVDNAMRAAERITLDDGTVIVKRFVDGTIDYQKVHEPHAVSSSQAINSTPDQRAIHAARWIVASYADTECDNLKHKHGKAGNQLLTQDECLTRGVFGSPREWQGARDWLLEQWLIVEHTRDSGTFADKSLRDMLDILTALPQRGNTS